MNGKTPVELKVLLQHGVLGHLSDHDLLAACVQSSAAYGRSELAREVLVKRHSPMIVQAIRRRVDDSIDVDDVLQKTLISLFKNAHLIREPGSLEGWLRRTAENFAMQAARSASRLRKRNQEWALGKSTVYHHPFPTETEGLIGEEIARLPEKIREPFVGCVVEDASPQEVASRLKIKISTLRSRIEKARGQLRERLLRRGHSPETLALAPLARIPLADSSAATVLSRFMMPGQALLKIAPSMMNIFKARMIATCLILSMTLITGGAPPHTVHPSRGPSIPSPGAQSPRKPDEPGRSSRPDELGPLSDRELEDLGYKKHREAKYDEAETYFSEWIRRDGVKNPRPWIMRGWTRTEGMKLGGAADDFSIAHRLDPRDREPLHGLYRVAMIRANYKEALRHIDEAISRDPRHATQRIGRATALIALSDLDGAIRECDTASQLAANDTDEARSHNDAELAKRERRRAEQLKRIVADSARSGPPAMPKADP